VKSKTIGITEIIAAIVYQIKVINFMQR